MRFVGKRPGMNLKLGYLLMSRKLFTNYFSKEFLHSLIIISGAQFHMWVFIQSVEKTWHRKRLMPDRFLKVYDPHIILYLRFSYCLTENWSAGHFRRFSVPKTTKYSIEYLKKVKHLVVIGWDTHARTKSLSEKKGAKKLNLRPFVHQREIGQPYGEKTSFREGIKYILRSKMSLGSWVGCKSEDSNHRFAHFTAILGHIFREKFDFA